MKSLIIIIMIIITSPLLSVDWQFTGPGSVTTVSRIFVDGDDLYTAADGRVYKSTDMGESWKMLNDYSQKNFGYINALIASNKKIFVGTLYGLFKTSDDGKNWYRDSINGESSIVWDMKINGDDIFLITNGGKIFLSTDSGKNWNLISPDSWEGGRVIEIDGENIYVGGLGGIDKPCLWISNDYGKNWTKVEDTLKGLKSEEIISIVAIGSRILVGTNDFGTYISDNGGETWKLTDVFYLNFYPITAFAKIGDTIYAGDQFGLYISTDRGNEWSLVDFPYQVNDIEINSSNIYIATHGIGISTDNGNNWKLKMIAGGSINVFDIVSHYDNIFAATSREGVYTSKDQGKTWEKFVGIPNNAKVSKIAFLDSSIFFTNPGPSPRQLNYSNDFGKTWNTVSDTDGISYVNINCFAVDENKKNVFAGNQYGLYISKNKGLSWNLVNENLNFSYPRDIVINNEEIFVADHQSIIYISSDYGDNWKICDFKNNLPSGVIFTAIAKSRNNIMAGTYGSDNFKGIYLTKDYGETWLNVNDVSTSLDIIDLLSYDNYVFAGSNSGVIISSDCGENWYRPVNSLTTFIIYKLLIKDRYIYAATPEGVFKAPLSDFGIVNVEKQTETKNYLYCYPPYPNPSTNIVRSLIYWDTSIDIENDNISVYDIYGNKVAGKEQITIDKQNQYSGLLTWNCSNVPDGIYLIRLIHGTETRTMKVIVSK